jgi:putative nucleotidyltransferase with HDIG domain
MDMGTDERPVRRAIEPEPFLQMAPIMTPNEIIANVKNLSAVSHAALKLVTLLDRPEVSNEDIVTTLKYDTVLTAKLLHTCNSPSFGFEEKISSVEQAVLMLGHQQILRMVMTLGFGGAMSTTSPGHAIAARELWTHSLTTAVAGEHLAKAEMPFEAAPSVAFTAGLLHDIGKLALAETLGDERLAAIRALLQSSAVSNTEAEKRVIGTDHSEVGACLLEKWRLPGDIVEAVLNHHHPIFEPEPRLSVMIHIADQLAHCCSSSTGWESFSERVDPRAIAMLHITPTEFESVLTGIRESAGQVGNFMNV